ncbi:MAG: tRNA pseudouridine(13) synthase TruD [Pseudomonadota bacterium]
MHTTEESTKTLAFAHGGPAGCGAIRSTAEDFVVDEELGFDLTGEGEHVFVRIKKRGENTEFLARRLARYAGVTPRDVSYAGLKDRHAVTTQWFSVHLPGRPDPQWSGFADESFRVLKAKRHNRKLRRGALSGNTFRIVVRDVKINWDCFEETLGAIADGGVPNYFGEQRFGRNGGNITQAIDLLSGRLKLRDRHKQGLLLSAARAHLFNEVLSERVEAGSWNTALPGDTFAFDRSNRYFRTEALDQHILERVAGMEIHPTGPLWGAGPLEVSGEGRRLESEIAARHPELSGGLERFGVDMARRTLRVRADGLNWDLASDGSLALSFSLAAGAYATTLLRELMRLGG